MRKWIRWLVWAAFIAVTVAIFMFSAQPAEQSSNLSQGVLTEILEKSIPSYKSMTAEEKLNLIKLYHSIIRKFAHFLIYALWGVLLSWLLWLYRINGHRQMFIAVASGFLYACSDEFHQLFSLGRSAQWSDVFLDTFGVLTGASAVWLLHFICKKIERNRLP